MKIKTMLQRGIRMLRKAEPQMYLQEYLFRQALMEVGIVPEGPISIDHMRGNSGVYGVQFGIRYPRAYIKKASELPIDRKYKYVFLGNMNSTGRRKEMLEPFMGVDSLISEDNFGRNPETKYSFNALYYSALRSSYFSLCPHQADWQGPRDAMWTYRFIESTFSETLPIVFRLAPCSEQFLDGFHYFWDDEAHSLDNYQEKVKANKKLAEKRFFMADEEVDRLKAAIASPRI